MSPPSAIALHGGAGVRPDRDYAEAEAHLAELARVGAARLAAGDAALDVVDAAVQAMEASGFYVAGRGSPPNKAGYVELDASIMDGARRRAGSVCAVRDVVHPIAVARGVMDATPHVMLAGDGAMDFVRAQAFAEVSNPADYYRLAIGVEPDDLENALGHGTVGAVALDRDGALAAGTSTGGVFGKLPGRVGDTPIVGAGTWADEAVAVSCTGVGELFILAGGAQDVASRVKYQGVGLQAACEGLISDVGRLGGDGGVIAVNRAGEVAFAFNSPGMKRAASGSAFAGFAAVR